MNEALKGLWVWKSLNLGLGTLFPRGSEWLETLPGCFWNGRELLQKSLSDKHQQHNTYRFCPTPHQWSSLTSQSGKGFFCCCFSVFFFTFIVIGINRATESQHYNSLDYLNSILNSSFVVCVSGFHHLSHMVVWPYFTSVPSVFFHSCTFGLMLFISALLSST